MDDLRIHIDEIVLDGSAPGEDVIGNAILEKTSEPLSPQLLSSISRAVAGSLGMDPPGGTA